MLAASVGALRACLEVSGSTRDAVVTLAKNLANQNAAVTYTQGSSRWQGINSWVCPLKITTTTFKAPAYADCSSFVSWLFWTAYGLGPDKLNGQSWKAGYTGSMADHGIVVSNAIQNTATGVWSPASTAYALPGDLCFYGLYPHVHVTMYVGNGIVVNFGSSNHVTYQTATYHPSRLQQIRRYFGTASNLF